LVTVEFSIVIARYSPVSPDTDPKIWYHLVAGNPHVERLSDRYVPPIPGALLLCGVLFKNAFLADWFQSRLSYTRSVAASSMVGYIVGLGDRHSMNILIDQETAEVVHIDLGVAFEQGLMLKTPERVCLPFQF
ncbi:hypothetical protein BHE74_00020747, partial [Ensete ventricosum]